MIGIECPRCRKQYKVREPSIGGLFVCKNADCRHAFTATKPPPVPVSQGPKMGLVARALEYFIWGPVRRARLAVVAGVKAVLLYVASTALWLAVVAVLAVAAVIVPIMLVGSIGRTNAPQAPLRESREPVIVIPETSERASAIPENGDPNKPPAWMKQPKWIDELTDKNGVHRRGYWRETHQSKKP